eukprot:GHVN01006083.1.p1 GENE.GHVN01006083.1~~GHVN01006083.1.p1  ORF type:complete len:345 (+),score=89.82 GHVN01006083.1:1024-2058(+)
MLNAEKNEELPCIPSLIRSITSLKSLISPQSDAIPAHSIFTLPPSTGRVYRQACLEAIREFSQGPAPRGTPVVTLGDAEMYDCDVRRVGEVSEASGARPHFLQEQILNNSTLSSSSSPDSSSNSPTIRFKLLSPAIVELNALLITNNLPISLTLPSSPTMLRSPESFTSQFTTLPHSTFTSVASLTAPHLPLSPLTEVLMLPISDQHHWSLLLIDRVNQRSPRGYFLDPLGLLGDNFIKAVLLYEVIKKVVRRRILNEVINNEDSDENDNNKKERKEKEGQLLPVTSPGSSQQQKEEQHKSTSSSISLTVVPAACQRGSSDCGVYVLIYTDLILTSLITKGTLW